jgi:hypothetical protein
MSLQNWLSATGAIAREETVYLSYTKDLANLASPADNPVLRLEKWVETTMIWLWQGFRKVSSIRVFEIVADHIVRIISTISRSTQMYICTPDLELDG